MTLGLRVRSSLEVCGGLFLFWMSELQTIRPQASFRFGFVRLRKRLGMSRPEEQEKRREKLWNDRNQNVKRYPRRFRFGGVVADLNAQRVKWENCEFTRDNVHM